ncbi:hypothetical protein MNB_SV-5-244 [hydrothermal vent metagenome]|uniref:Uncharacterized protein n=1 Tax=hydrothermal vent metagenome TaxID=652676 RepID=A0A1W1EET5_9ZZZZ
MTQLKILALAILSLFILNTQAVAKHVRDDMPFICKYEAKRNFGVKQSSVQTLPAERIHKGFTVYGQTPKNTKKALFFQCYFDHHGNYVKIRKTRDYRYNSGGANKRVPETVKRICKGEASYRWRMKQNYIRIKNAKRVGKHDYIVNLSARNYRGTCEVSKSGHIYKFQTRYANNNVSSSAPSEALWSCKRRAASRWGTRLNNVRVIHSRRLGRDDYNVKLSFRDYRVNCEVSGRGRIYLFSEY